MSADSPSENKGDAFLAPKPGHHVPLTAGTVGMWLFLASLTMLFIAGLIGYVLVRNLNRQKFNITLHLPPLLWVSSVLVIGVSLSLARAVNNIRLERQAPFRKWLLATLAFACGFLIVQTPAMIALFREHLQFRTNGIAIYGLLFFLILLHALHVVGGMIALAIVTTKGLRGGYDHETCTPVKHAAMYWHFIDIVWLVMFTTILIAG